MKISRSLNLVIPIDRENDAQIYVHATPISLEVFEQHYMVIARAFTVIYTGGLGAAGGPAVARMVLRTVAEERGVWDGPAGVQNTLLAEIRRLSNVVMPNPDSGGWMTLPLDVAVTRELLDAEELAEVENRLAFFTVASRMSDRRDRTTVMEGLGRLWGTQVSLLDSTEFARSLPTSSATGSSGGTVPTSSVPT